VKSILLFIAIVAVGVGVWYGGTYVNRSADHILPGTVVTDGGMKHVEEGQYYSVEITYPEKTPLLERSRGADTKARDAMELFFLNDVTQFKQNINADTVSGPEKEMLDTTGRKYLYQVTYRALAAANQKLISYKYDIVVDTGGAHPNLQFKTFTFDKNGNEVKLPDLFVEGSDYLQRISTFALKDVATQLKERMGEVEGDLSMSISKEGLAPIEENFSNFLVDGDDLLLFIPPYQAAAYAAGSFEIRIPLSLFSDILKPEWK
jgi:hypothetical protein